MSGESQDGGAVSVSAVDIQTRAADWIFDRYDSESWSPEDQANLDAWLDESLAHRVAYVRLETMLNRSTRLAALRQAPPTSLSRSGEEPSRTRPFLTWVAAIIAVAVLAGFGMSTVLLAPKVQTYSTALGEHKTVTLADGSQIELNTNTILRTQVGEHKRAVWLDAGEVYFQVKHDAARPFVVTAASYRVTDLGTEFSIRNDANYLEVALIKGRARFESADAAVGVRSTNLTPGDVVIATANKMVVTKRTEQKLANELAWRHGLLVFNYATLADAATEFNRYNRKKLVVADPATARLTIMGKFPANDVALFGQIAKTILGVRVEARNDAIVISR